ncbi:TonB-dependent receptor domain-containing protein [Bacteroidota bacterium]
MTVIKFFGSFSLLPLFVIGFLLFGSLSVFGQEVTIKGTVVNQLDEPLFGVVVHVGGIIDNTLTDEYGKYSIKGLPAGLLKLTFFQQGFKKVEREVKPINGKATVDVRLEPLSKELEGVTVSGKRKPENVMTTLRAVEGTAIYAGRKTEVIQMSNISANLGANRARQVFAQVAGLNIWESDCAGIQIGVGGRGLSPSRTESFNTRQNGYDIAADALGYPESYYSPPMLAIDKVEIVRGAASLQYGPQFGGMLNFVMKDGADSAKIQVESNQTIGSYKFFNSFNSIGGTIGRFKYFTFFQYRTGDCWRSNSEFDNYTAYGALTYKSLKGTSVKLEYTNMWYLTHQAGGLTDREFEENPRLSDRKRNWFRVKWNVMSLSVKHEFSSASKLDVKLFGLLAVREALGFLGPANQSDPIDNPSSTLLDQYRNLIHGDFNNIGAEFRFLQRYSIKSQPQVFLTGIRLYKGLTNNKQGAADAGAAAVFKYENDVIADASTSSHPSGNIAWFAENIFNITRKLSVTPGVRVEFISTSSNGSARTVYRDQADNVILDTIHSAQSNRQRWFPLFGLGVSYKPLKQLELYSNFSQNYKSINFNDLWVTNPSYRVDPEMKDETGFNADLGLRGNVNGVLQFDLTAFFMMYNDRIGYVQKTDPELFSIYRLRTNVANARTVGLETYVRWNVIKTFSNNTNWKAAMFSNITWLDAKYVSTDESAFRNKEVESTPSFLIRAGADVSFKGVQLSYLFSFTDQQYTDATNAVYTGNAVNGLIPSYYVMDINLSYTYKKFTLNTGIENVMDKMYFTRRATGYPGPGIIPSAGRTFFLSLGIKV